MKEYLNDFTRFEFILNHYLAPFALRVIGAFALWIASGFVIRWTKRLLRKALEVRKVDPTLIIYASQTLGVALRALTVVAILNLFGIETTSFSAILAAAGVAIGVAWSGLLSNFAAGIFLILFRPFKSGDSITAGGVTGVVREIDEVRLKPLAGTFRRGFTQTPRLGGEELPADVGCHGCLGVLQSRGHVVAPRHGQELLGASGFILLAQSP